MKLINFQVGLAASIFLSGCVLGPRTSSWEFLGLVQQDPDLHLGQFIAGAGTVVFVAEDNVHNTRFELLDRNFNFVINYPNKISNLTESSQVSFLGRVSGEVDRIDSRGGRIRAIRVQAIEVDCELARYYMNSEMEYITAWYKNNLPLR